LLVIDPVITVRAPGCFSTLRAGRPSRAVVRELKELPMGLIANLRFGLQRARNRGKRTCSHLDQIHEVTPSSTGCQPCLDLGDTWVHLRMCMTDGQVLCCDSSKNKHASRHARHFAPTHQIVRSMQPGEDWLWCYTDQTLVQAPAGGPTS
jgi:hypothetical protein